MQSFLIAAKDKQARERITTALCEEHEIHHLDVTTVESEKSIGIEDVRNMQKTVFLKPLRGNKKVVVIKNAHTATLQAQNALLKLLEEPPPDTIMILTTHKKELLLPTILSRCSVVEIDREEQKTPADHPILTLSTLSIAKRLHLAQEVGKTREDALTFLEEAVTATRNALLTSSHAHRLLRSLQETHTVVETTNVSPRLTLETLLLNL